LLPEDRIGSWLVLAVLAGMLSNYLGPYGQVHVAYNPLTFVLAWNLAVFALLAWRRLRSAPAASQIDASATDADAATSSSESQAATAAHSSHDTTTTSAALHAVAPSARSRSRRSGLGRWLLADLYLKWVGYRAKYEGARERVADTGAVASAFSQSYWSAAGAVIVARLETLVHVAAIGILVGALVGTYLRGLFFEYNAVWRSTFLTGPDSVAAFLNLLLGPAALLIDGRLLSAQTVAPLLDPAGAPAGPWIHKLAVTAALVVIPPRTLLAFLSARHARAAARCIRLDFSDPYYTERIASVREGLGHRIRDAVATTFRIEVAKLSESVALFVRERFFDKAVAPSLVAFRNRGGRIEDLETELAAATLRFEPALSEHLRAAQRELERALAAGLRTVIGREMHPASSALAAASPTELPLRQSVTGAVATNVGDAIGATVTAAVTAAVATISGGVGKTLGVAVLSGLLGTSGPIGLLIGAVAALAVVGGAYFLGRDRVTEAIKKWSIPASVVSLALRDSKIEQARQATYDQVRAQIRERLEPQIAEVTEAILRELPLAAC